MVLVKAIFLLSLNAEQVKIRVKVRYEKGNTIFLY